MDFEDDYDEYSEGFQIEGENLDGSQPADAADAWLLANENKGITYESDQGTEHISPNEQMGMATAADIQLARFQNTEPRIQAGLIAAIDGTLQGVDEIDRAAAVEQFGAEIGGNPAEFIRQLKVDASVQPPRHKQDLSTVLSMLGTTSGEYMDKGPGANLANHTLSGEKQAKKDEELKTALGYVSELADLYIDGRTRGSTIEAAKRSAIENSLTNRFMNGVFIEGAKTLMPMPNELFHNGTDGSRVTGTIMTQGMYPSKFGTALTRLDGGELDREDEASRTLIPHLGNSLYPKPYEKGATYTKEQKDKLKRDQEYYLGQAQYKADYARRVLLEQMPTHRDESAQQGRTAGFDRPYDEQDRIQSLRDEAVRRGLDWYAGDDISGLTTDQIEKHGKGSDKAGMYGQKLKSEVDQFVDQVEAGEISLSSSKVVPDGSDRAAYLAHLAANPQPKQGSAEWLALRKGNITASAVVGGFGKPALTAEGGVEEAALNLALEKAGMAEPFVGNSHTKDGNDGESAVLASFLAGPGKHLSYEEAFFESGEKNGMPGWGVSPDGRLYDPLTGKSKGLLELKYLSDVKGATKKYNDQMQTQMMVTGETQTSFYALNKYNGEYEYNVVHADPERQAQLKQAGDMAISMSAGLDARGIQALTNITNDKLDARQPADAQGQTEPFQMSAKQAVEKMTAFDPNNTTTTAGSINRAESTIFAEQMKKMEAQEQVAKAKDILGSMDEGAPSSPQESRARMQAKARFGNNNSKPDAFGSESDSEMSNHYKRAEAEASKKATESMNRFSEATSAAVSVLGGLSGAVLDGNQSGMDEVRLAAETGIDVKNLRGMRKALEDGGMSEGQINSSFNQVGGLVKSFNDEESAVAKYTDILSRRGKSSLASIKNMSLPGYEEFKSLDPQQMSAMIIGSMAGKSKEERAQIDNIYGTSFATNTTGADVVGSAVDENIFEDGLLSTWKGIKDVTQWTRDFGEGLGSSGEVVGALAAGTAVGVGVAGKMLGGRAGGFMGKGGQAFMNAAKSGGPKVAAMTKNLSNAAKVTPLAAAFAVAPMAVRHVADIKDDGGIGDSAMDIMEFAGYGAAIGSVVPGVVTAIGAGVGLGAGVINEAWEWMTADDAMPDESIGKMPSPSEVANKGNKINNNVDVNVEINGSDYRVATNVNGDELLDEGSGYGHY